MPRQQCQGDIDTISLHVIIDGYNLIRSSDSWRALDAEDILLGREALIARLADYKKIKSHRLTVVFDGTSAPFGTSRHYTDKGVQIRFSRPGETADAVIKRMVAKERQRALVVSSDREVASAAEAKGAAIIGAGEFEFKLLAALDAGDFEAADKDSSAWKPGTKKKGPARRRPRRDRYNRNKIRKL